MPLHQNAFLMVAGPSGVGKTTFVDGLIKRWPDLYVRPISYTSRPRREGEGDSEYRFVEEIWILEEFRKGHLANLDLVYGSYYAMAKSSIEDAFASGRSPIKEIHPANHYKIRSLFKHSAAVLFLPDANTSRQRGISTGARSRDDAAFYSNINYNDFEIIARALKSSDLNTLISDTHFSIQMFLRNNAVFPSPREIDILNAEGYGALAGRFTASERPTTTDFHVLTAPFFESAINNINSGAACLEIGPGQGWLRKTFRWPSVQYSALDIAAEMISTLDFETDDCVKIAAPARAMPFPSASFDYIFASLGDGYCYPAALAEIRRVLKLNGTLYFSAPSAVWSRGLRQGHCSNKTSFLLPKGKHVEVFSFVFTVQELQALLTGCGFRISEAEEIFGNKLPQNREISPALVASARSLGVPVETLPIVNVVMAVRRE